MKCSTVLAAVLVLGVVLCARAERVSLREEDPLDDDLADRANLLFRSMDKNRDMMLDAEDARASEEQLELHMPGISSADFVEFIQLADKNNDGHLSRSELFQGLADGITQNEEAAQPESLIEAEAEIHAEAETDSSRKGIGGLLKKGLKAAGRFAKNMLFGKKKGGGAKGDRSAKGRVNKKADGCVMCQYLIERLEANVKQSGVIPAMSQAQGLDGLSFLEVEEEPMGEDVPANSGAEFAPFGMVPPMQTPTDEANPLVGNAVQMPEINIGGAPSDANLPQEVPAIQLVDESEQQDAPVMLETEQLYLDQTAAGIIGSTRQSTRVQRQLERQKYNEIYRVVDITLDDICEQSMPNSFYGFCKQIYKVQSDVVDGLRYQYRPTDICFRIGMCGKKSYITKGIHSRYK